MIESTYINLNRTGNANVVNPKNIRPGNSKETESKIEKKDSSLFKGEMLDVSQSVNLKDLLTKAEKIPEIRGQLVEKFRKAIEDGIYKPDLDRISKKLAGV